MTLINHNLIPIQCARIEAMYVLNSPSIKGLYHESHLINATHQEEIRVAITKDGKLTDLNIETSLNQKTKGNVYKAKISRVEQSLEAAFVDYGKERHGFLPFKEVSDFFAIGVKPKGEN
jgi:Ribonuclease G/E